MTHLKKSLALLMAFVMMFTSMSVAASAFDAAVDGGFDLNFKVKFFREVDGEWVETSRAKAGDHVKARMYVTTDYPAASSNLAMVFDSDLFIPLDYSDAVTRDLTVNPAYNEAGSGTELTGSRGVWYAEETRHTYNRNNYWVTQGYIPEDFFAHRDLMAFEVYTRAAGSVRDHSVFKDAENWMIEVDFTVLDGTAANTVNYVGEAFIPKELTYNTKVQKYMPIDVPKGELGVHQMDTWGMHLWDANITTVEGTITTTSNYILDANGGAFDEYGTTAVAVPGIIGKQVTGFGSSQPTKYGYNFIGWTKNPVAPDHKITAAIAEELGLDSDSVGTVLTNEQLDQLIIRPEDYHNFLYDYDDQYVYAAWTKADSQVIWNHEIYMLKVGGDASKVEDYELKASVPYTAEIGDKVERAEDTLYTGFHLNKDLSDESIIVTDSSSKLKQYYARNIYNVTYNYTDASEEPQSETYSVAFGEEVPPCEANPGKEGFTFLGWSLNSDNTIKNVPEIMPANDLQIYAAFEENVYNYVFKAESDEGVKGTFADGTSIKNFELKHGEEFSFDSKPTAEGYNFVGWDEDLDNPEIAKGDRTFTACYSAKSFKVEFVANGQTIKDDYYEYGQAVKASDVPENYPATGWTVDGITLVEFPYTVTEEVTFVATEEALYRDAIFRVDGVEYDRESVKIGEKIPVPTTPPEKSGYDFVGWDPYIAENEDVMTEEGAVYDAVFEPKTVTITFDTDGGTEIEPIVQEYGTDVTAPADPTKTGYEFLSWDTRIPTTMPADDLTIKALWSAITYKAVFKDTDGTIYSSENYKYGEEITVIADPQKTGYTFAGWENLPADKKMPASDLEIFANWEYIEYTISFDSNGGTPETISPIKGIYGKAISAPTVTKEGSTFLGWALADDESQTVISFPSTMPAEDMNLKAVWVADTFTATFDAAGGIFESGSSIHTVPNLKYGDTVQAPADPEREGWIFKGWTPEVGTMPNGDIKYTAKWERGKYDYTINIVATDANGESVSFSPETGKGDLGDTLEVYLEGNTSTADIKYVYEKLAPTSSYVPDPDKCDVTAITISEQNNVITIFFKLKEVTVTFLANGGEFADGAEEVVRTGKVGSSFEFPDEPTRVGYTFKGWNSEVLTTFTENTVYRATWEKQTHNAIFNVTLPDGSVDTITVPYEYGEEITAPKYMVGEGKSFSGWNIPAGTKMGDTDMVFNATLTNDEYKISYHYDGDIPPGVKEPDDITFIYGQDITHAEVPEVEGYTFNGWYREDGREIKPGQTICMNSTGDMYLRGTWTKIPVDPVYKTVSYKFDGDAPEKLTPPDPAMVQVGTTVSVADIPSAVIGYTFDGWYKDGRLTESFVMPDADVEIIGRWTKNEVATYNVNYSFVGGTPVGVKEPNDDRAYAAGESVKVADVPTLDGWTFDGWYLNGEITTEFSMPATNVTLTGVWTQNEAETYIVEYAHKDGTTVPTGAPDLPTESYYEAGATVTVKAVPVLDGWTFDGWYLDGKLYKPGETFTMPENGVKLIGSWEEVVPETHRVTYEYRKAVPENVPPKPEDNNSYVKGATVTVAATPTLDGWTFGGWYYNGVVYDGITNSTFEMPDHDVCMVGEWFSTSPNTYVVKYTYEEPAPENAPKLPDSKSATKGETVTVAATPTLEGYVFDGWYYNGVKYDGVTNTSFEMPEESVLLTGKWTPIEYTLILDANGGKFADGTMQYTDSLTVGADINAPANPTKDGFVFAGWLDDDGTLVTKLPEKMPAASLTYTAKWEKEQTPTHTITYYIVKGGDAYQTDSYAEGETMTHPEVGEKDGIVYKGWVDEDGNAIPDVMGTSDITAYAVVDHVKKYKATYIVNGTTYKEYEIETGSEITVPDDPSLDGYVFSGWNPSIPQYMPANDLTFVASFEKAPDPEKNEYTATYIVDGKTYKSYVLKEGDAMQIPEDPTKFGCNFVGWEPDVPDTMPGYDVEFEAQWEVDKTFVTVVIGGTVIAGGVVAAVAGSNAAWITGVSIVGGVLVIAGTIALIKHTHTVTYLVDGEVYKTYKVVEGTKIPVPADPTKDGAQFKGWDPEVPEKMGNSDLVFEAVWENVEQTDSTEPSEDNVNVDIPQTGSVAGVAAFAVISGAMAAAYVVARKKKDD